MKSLAIGYRSAKQHDCGISCTMCAGCAAAGRRTRKQSIIDTNIYSKRKVMYQGVFYFYVLLLHATYCYYCNHHTGTVI